MYSISYKDYLDKVNGGWFGKCLGGGAGAPYEGIKKIIDIKDFKDVVNPELPNDDLDLQLLWIDVLQKKGLDIESCDLADAWLEKCWYPFSEYGYFLKNYERGIKPPYSGWFNNNFFNEGNGCPIRSEIWGFIFPGNPDIACRYANMDGVLDHNGNSVWIEQFFSAVESMAFFEDDLTKLIDIGQKYIPDGSLAKKCVNSILEFHESNNDWLSARNYAVRFFSHNDFSNSIINFVFVLIGLLYGEGKIEDSINIALKCGYDTDCTCATIGAILGTIKGYTKIEDSLKKIVNDKFIIGIDVKRDSNSIIELSKDTCNIGINAMYMMNKNLYITDMPSDIKINIPQKNKNKISMGIEYKRYPAIGYDDKCDFEIILINNYNIEISGELSFNRVPEDWNILYDKFNVVIKPGEKIKKINSVATFKDIKKLCNKNILQCIFQDKENNIYEEFDFGIAGANIWKVAGPYFKMMDEKPDPMYPSPHGDNSNLPSIESMVNNVVEIDKEYINENNLKESILKEDYIILNAYEDLINIDETFHCCGQQCLYLMQNIYSSEYRKVWIVIGNNDGYKLWLNDELVQKKDEIRLWTPYNNSILVDLKEGHNTLILKLLKRTENIRFSIGIRKYEGSHWHRKRWYTDFISCI